MEYKLRLSQLRLQFLPINLLVWSIFTLFYPSLWP